MSIKQNVGTDQTQIKFQHSSKSCSFNKTFLIVDDEAKSTLLGEMDRPDKSHLESAFNKHCQVLHFKENSGLCPFAILSVNVYIDRISPTIAASDSDTDSNSETSDIELD